MKRKLVLWGIAAQIIALSGCGSESLQQLATAENLDAQASGDPAISQASLGAGVVPVMEGADGSAPGPADDFQADFDGEVQVASLDGSGEAASESGGVAQDDALIVATDEGDEAVADEQAPVLEFEIAGFATDLVPPEPTSVVIKFRPGSSASERSALHRANGLLVDRTIPQLQIHTVKIPPGKSAEDIIARYDRHPLVEYAEVEQHATVALEPNDPYYYDPWQTWADANGWHLRKIDAPAAWDITTGSPDVIIAILDTGIYANHEDLRDKIVPGWNVYDDSPDTSDGMGHGTAVAGQAAAASNNGIGVAAPAWGCKLMPISVTDSGWTDSVTLANGVIWAADHGSRVANMSFEIFHTSILTDAAQYMQDRGGVVIQSAGNSASFTEFADDPLIIKVSGTDAYDEITGFSVTGNDIDLSAPAVRILTTGISGGYSSGTGTSAAAPIVSGVAALMLSVNPNLSGQDVQDILKQSADDLGPHGWDTGYGWGRVNAARAVQMARDFSSTPDETPPVVEIMWPRSGDVVSDLIIVVAVASDDTSEPLVDLLCNDSLVGTDTVPPHEWNIDTTQLPNGEHRFVARAFDAAGNSADSAPVYVTIDNPVTCDCPADCSAPATREIAGATCNDGLDNDCDGVTDCLDSDCAADSACIVGCGDGTCASNENACGCPQDCGAAPISESACDNGLDDDCDGAADCDDGDCAGDPMCVQPCGDGTCDAANGEDGCSCPQDCGRPPGVETDCTDGNDEDCDGLADGDDPDCAAASGCGNGVCEGNGEDCHTCPVDCVCRGKACRACCGDGVCDKPENRKNCPVDCGR